VQKLTLRASTGLIALFTNVGDSGGLLASIINNKNNAWEGNGVLELEGVSVPIEPGFKLIVTSDHSSAYSNRVSFVDFTMSRK
jgi:hypothetical protein